MEVLELKALVAEEKVAEEKKKKEEKEFVVKPLVLKKKKRELVEKRNESDGEEEEKKRMHLMQQKSAAFEAGNVGELIDFEAKLYETTSKHASSNTIDSLLANATYLRHPKQDF